MSDEVAFLPAVKHESFLQVIVSFWVCKARHDQSRQTNKFAISFQYPKEKLNDKADFLTEDKERFIQIDTIILGVFGQTCANYLKLEICYFFAISYKRKQWWSWFFACRGAWRSPTNQCYGFDWDGWAFPYHYNIIEILLQYLKQEGRDEVDFLHADKHQSWF